MCLSYPHLFSPCCSWENGSVKCFFPHIHRVLFHLLLYLYSCFKSLRRHFLALHKVFPNECVERFTVKCGEIYEKYVERFTVEFTGDCGYVGWRIYINLHKLDR